MAKKGSAGWGPSPQGDLFQQLGRSLFGKDIVGLDFLPLQVLYGLAGALMLVVLYFVIFVL